MLFSVCADPRKNSEQNPSIKSEKDLKSEDSQDSEKSMDSSALGASASSKKHGNRSR